MSRGSRGGGSRSAIEVATDDTAIRVEDVRDRLVITSFKSPADQVDWIGGAKEALPIPFIQKLRIGDREMAIDWKFAGSGADTGRPGAMSMRFKCAQPPLELVSTWIAASGPGPIEHELVIFNRGTQPIVLPAQESLAVRGKRPGA